MKSICLSSMGGANRLRKQFSFTRNWFSHPSKRFISQTSYVGKPILSNGKISLEVKFAQIIISTVLQLILFLNCNMSKTIQNRNVFIWFTPNTSVKLLHTVVENCERILFNIWLKLWKESLDFLFKDADRH